VLARVDHLHLEAVHEQQPVRQARQRVVQRLVARALLAVAQGDLRAALAR
jgi:hypothetical protein